jgi:DNA gyrase/topoisomerase IV subunit A
VVQNTEEAREKINRTIRFSDIQARAIVEMRASVNRS